MITEVQTKIYGTRTTSLIDTGTMTTLENSTLIPHKFNIAKRRKAKIRIQALGHEPANPLPVVRFCLYLRDYKGYTRRLWVNAAIYNRQNSDHKIILGMNFINEYVLAIKGHCIVLKDNNGHLERTVLFAKPQSLHHPVHYSRMHMAKVTYFNKHGQPRKFFVQRSRNSSVAYKYKNRKLQRSKIGHTDSQSRISKQIRPEEDMKQHSETTIA